MLEIIAIIFLCRANGRLAERKGLPARRWWLYTVIAWLVAEFTGLFLGILLFGQYNLYGLMALGLVSAFGGYLYIKAILDKKPDASDEDEINRIGSDDLRPPYR